MGICKNYKTYLIVLFSLFLSVFIVSNETSAYADLSLESQYSLIYKNYDKWDISDYNMSGAYYAVTDLDGNGRLEVISTMNYSTGGHTHMEVFEVNETGTGLIPLRNGIDLSDFPLSSDWHEGEDSSKLPASYWEDYYSPDFRYSDSEGIPFFYTENGTREFILKDYYSCGQESKETLIESLSLNNGSLKVKPLMIYKYERFPTETEEYFDQNYRKISKNDFENWKSLYKGCEEGSASFEWFYDVSESQIKHSYEVFANSIPFSDTNSSGSGTAASTSGGGKYNNIDDLPDRVNNNDLEIIAQDWLAYPPADSKVYPKNKTVRIRVGEKTKIELFRNEDGDPGTLYKTWYGDANVDFAFAGGGSGWSGHTLTGYFTADKPVTIFVCLKTDSGKIAHMIVYAE